MYLEVPACTVWASIGILFAFSDFLQPLSLSRPLKNGSDFFESSLSVRICVGVRSLVARSNVAAWYITVPLWGIVPIFVSGLWESSSSNDL